MNNAIYRWAKYHLSRPKCRDCEKFAIVKRFHRDGTETCHCQEHDTYNQTEGMVIDSRYSSVEDSLEQLANAILEDNHP